MGTNYLFRDKVSGEEFIVLAPSKAEATETAKLYFEKPVFIDALSWFEAECMGIDTY